MEGFESLAKGSSGEESGDDNGGDGGDFDDYDDLEDNEDMDTDRHSEKSTHHIPHPTPFPVSKKRSAMQGLGLFKSTPQSRSSCS
jgi:hypothetical protein